jgi:hypothetical protein
MCSFSPLSRTTLGTPSVFSHGQEALVTIIKVRPLIMDTIGCMNDDLQPLEQA